MANFTGYTIDDKERRDEEFSFRAVVDKTHLRYSSKLHDVNWAYIADQILPSLNLYRKSVLFHSAGQFSTNPLLLLSKVMQDEKYTTHIMKSDQEFRFSIKSFANDLSRYAQEFDTENTKIETSSLEYSLRRTFHNDQRLMNEFLSIFDTLLNRYDIFMPNSTKQSMDHHDLFKRDEQDEIELALPYGGSECWDIGGSHFGALESESSANLDGQMSSIDMAPSLFQKVRYATKRFLLLSKCFIFYL